MLASLLAGGQQQGQPALEALVAQDHDGVAERVTSTDSPKAGELM
jgi:hypothetical protein